MADVARVESAQTFVLIAVLTLAALYDLTSKRIPNFLTISGLLLGLVLATASGITAGLLHLAAAALMLAIGLPLFAWRVLGGGDVKLLAAVGGMVGLHVLPAALAFACIAGGILALLDAIRRGVLRRVLANSYTLLIHWLSFGRSGKPLKEVDATTTLPYGVAIAVGAIFAWFMK